MLDKILLVILVTLIVPKTASAVQIYKCGAGDNIVFQDAPCKTDFDYGLSHIDTFDGWKYGMNILAMKEQAKLRTLPISPGNQSLISKYNEKFLNNSPESRVYTYMSGVAGKKTKVSLYFTQSSQKLYKVKASFVVLQLPVEEKKYFYSSLVNQLSKKYGSYLEARDYPYKSNMIGKMILKDLVGTEKVWGWDTDNVISLTGNSPVLAMYELTYKYVPLLKQSVIETTTEIKESTDKALARDYSKL